MNLSRVAVLVFAAVWTCHPASAQMRRPKAEVAPYAAATVVAAGSTTRVALTVTLPEGLHVQSDAPRDPSLIPTVLTVEAPAGVTVRHLIYPTPSDFAQAGQPQPLAVFEHEFVTGAELAIAGDAPVGDLVIPGRLRYQACDDRVCFAPQTGDVRVARAGGARRDGRQRRRARATSSRASPRAAARIQRRPRRRGRSARASRRRRCRTPPPARPTC